MAHRYEPVESKNEYMRSYKRDFRRVNYYFTRNTIQIQNDTGFLGKGGGIIIRNATPEEVETYL